MRICKCCGETKDDVQFSYRIMPDGKIRYRGMCKKCHALTTSNKEKERKISLFPEFYWQCSNEECNYINPKSRTKCYRCGGVI